MPREAPSLPFEGRQDFPQIGAALFLLGPGEPIGMYHWEADREDVVDEAARRHGASVERAPSDQVEAYARFPEPRPVRYVEGSLPG